MAARTRKRPVRKIGRKMKTKLFALFMLIVVAMLGLIGRLKMCIRDRHHTCWHRQ